MEINGQCSCGHVHYQLTKEPMFIHACNYGLCKRQTGSAFIAHAFIESTHFKLISGSLRAVFGASGSGSPHEVDRCIEYGTAIISYYKGQRAWGVVKVETLYCPNNFPPNVHLHVKQKVSWINIPDDVPTFDEGYDLQAVWPKESYERLQKIF